MNGYRLTFYTQQGRTHNHMSIAEWLLREAKAIGVEGATFAAAQGGYGRDGKYHSTRFFDVGEQPMEVTMAVSPEHSEQLFARIEQETLAATLETAYQDADFRIHRGSFWTCFRIVM